MTSNRRDFLWDTMLGTGILTIVLAGHMASLSNQVSEKRKRISSKQQFNMSGYAVPKLDKVRIGFFVLFFNLLVSGVNAQTKSYLVFDPYYRTEQNLWMKYTDNSNVFYHHIAGLAEKCLLQREETVARLNSLKKWKSYLKGLQRTLDSRIGEFKKTLLNAHVTGTLDRPNFRVEKIVFESLPGFYVTGCLFIPKNGKKPFPAVLYAIGHSPNSFRRELYQQNILNLVNKGFVVFTYDPIGQGERIQYLDSLVNSSVLKGTTQEHSYAGAQCLLTGNSISDYFLWDGIRALDYLFTRPEVDTLRIGMTGISGGGTQTAILSAIDKRIYAAAPECFITSNKRLFESIGPQDAEQNLYHGLKLGIEHADFLSLRAPKPTMIISTTQDFFTIQGARETYSNVKKVFDAYGKPENLSMVEADGPHGTEKGNRENMYRFFQRHLSLPGNSMDEDFKFFTEAELKVTPTGQVSTSYQSKTVFDLNNERATQLIKSREVKSPQKLKKGQEVLLNKIKELSGYDSTRSILATVFTGKIERKNYKIEKYFIESKDFNYTIPFVFIKPYSDEKRPVILYLSSSGKEDLLSNENEISDYINQGYSILAPDLIGIGELKSTSFKGDSYINGYPYNFLFGINLVGKSVAGIQSSDLDVLFKYIKTRNDINVNDITSLVKDELCSTYLHFAIFHNTIACTILVNPLISYEDIIHTKYYQSKYLWTAVPGAIPYYDLLFLESMLSPSRLLIINPVNAKGDVVSQQLIEDKLSFLLESYQSKNAEKQLQIKLTKDEDILHLISTNLHKY